MGKAKRKIKKWPICWTDTSNTPDKDLIVELREQLLIESVYFQQLNTRSQQLAVLLNQFKTEYNRQPSNGQHYSDVYPSLSDSLRNLHQFMTRLTVSKQRKRRADRETIAMWSQKQKVNAEIEDVIEEIRDLLYEMRSRRCRSLCVIEG